MDLISFIIGLIVGVIIGAAGAIFYLRYYVTKVLEQMSNVNKILELLKKK